MLTTSVYAALQFTGRMYLHKDSEYPTFICRAIFLGLVAKYDNTAQMLHLEIRTQLVMPDFTKPGPYLDWNIRHKAKPEQQPMCG